MEPKSSAIMVPYDVRPTKQLERRLILDIIRVSAENGFPVESSVYLGMGGVHYIDFQMVHRYLGISKLISLEHDKKIAERCKFNKPYDNIEFYDSKLSDFLGTNTFERSYVMWFDSDWSLSPDLKDDLLTIGSKLPPWSWLFVTVSGCPIRSVQKMKPPQRFEWYAEHFKGFVGDLKEADYKNSKIAQTLATIVGRIVEDSFNGRVDGSFSSLMRILYRDSKQMITFGGCFIPNDHGTTFFDVYAKNFGFLKGKSESAFYSLPQINITEAERRLLDIAVTSPPRKRKARNQAKLLGFGPDYLLEYKRVVRFIPRYFEAYV